MAEFCLDISDAYTSVSRLEECNRNLFFLPSKRSLALKDYLRFKQIANQVIESFVTFYNPKINSNLVELSEGNSKCIMEFDTDKIVSSEQLYNCYNSSLLEIYLIKALYRGGAYKYLYSFSYSMSRFIHVD